MKAHEADEMNLEMRKGNQGLPRTVEMSEVGVPARGRQSEESRMKVTSVVMGEGRKSAEYAAPSGTQAKRSSVISNGSTFP